VNERVESEIRQFEARIEARFQAVASRCAALDSRCGGLDGRLTQLEATGNFDRAAVAEIAAAVTAELVLRFARPMENGCNHADNGSPST
jgi:hypothetical protein